METIGAELEYFREKTGVPAVIGGVVEADGAFDVDVVGVCRRDQPDELAQVDDQWHIGSCAKSMTAVLYARLVEVGLAEWGTPIDALFADIKLAKGWQTPTVDDLMRCRAGVASNPTGRQMLASWKSVDSPVEQRTGQVRQALSGKPTKPGTFQYSNLSYVLLGAAIDRLAGMPYEQALSTYVLEPLAIDSLGYGPPPRVCGHKPKFRLGPVMIGSGKPAPPGDEKSDNPPLLTPAGRMHLTLSDWAAFVRIFLTGGQPLLTKESVDHLLTLPDDGPRAMAMGWMHGRDAGGSYGMQGSNTMWGATALIDKDMRRAALVVTNDGRMTIVGRTAHLARRLLER